MALCKIDIHSFERRKNAKCSYDDYFLVSSVFLYVSIDLFSLFVFLYPVLNIFKIGIIFAYV